MISKHYQSQRSEREKFIEECLGEGHIIDGFIVDKGHVKGAEVHSITDNGIIIIHNLYSGKLVTKLIARVGQLKRYYYKSGREPPPYLLELARQHKSLGYNYL